MESESGITLDLHYPISQLMQGINIETSGTTDWLHSVNGTKLYKIMRMNHLDTVSRL